MQQITDARNARPLRIPGHRKRREGHCWRWPARRGSETASRAGLRCKRYKAGSETLIVAVQDTQKKKYLCGVAVHDHYRASNLTPAASSKQQRRFSATRYQTRHQHAIEQHALPVVTRWGGGGGGKVKRNNFTARQSRLRCCLPPETTIGSAR